MRRLFLSAMMIAFLAGMLPAEAQTVEGIEQAWRSWAARYGQRTGGMVVLHAGQPVREAAMGRQVVGEPVRLASLSKAITGVCIAHLIDRGRLSFDTPLSQIQGAHITGPYRWWTAVGARLSLADDGLTFGTNATQGVCIHFEPRIHRVLGLRDHSALNVTVEDCEGLVAAISGAG